MLPQRIAAACRRHPDALALLHLPPPSPQPTAAEPDFSGASPLRLSYGQLHDAACAVAAALPAACRGGSVAILLDDAPGSVLAELGVLYAGAAFVPLDPASPTARLRYQLRDCGCAALVHSRAQAARVRALLEAEALPLPTLEIETALEPLANPDSGRPGQQGAAADPPQQSDDHHPAPLRPSDRSHIIYTSGSTGAPKGVVCEHGALAAYADAKLAAHGIGEGARVLLVSAATWDPSGPQPSPAISPGCAEPHHRVLAVLSTLLLPS